LNDHNEWVTDSFEGDEEECIEHDFGSDGAAPECIACGAENEGGYF